MWIEVNQITSQQGLSCARAYHELCRHYEVRSAYIILLHTLRLVLLIGRDIFATCGRPHRSAQLMTTDGHSTRSISTAAAV